MWEVATRRLNKVSLLAALAIHTILDVPRCLWIPYRSTSVSNSPLSASCTTKHPLLQATHYCSLQATHSVLLNATQCYPLLLTACSVQGKSK